jgi:hypothetical protein
MRPGCVGGGIVRKMNSHLVGSPWKRGKVGLLLADWLDWGKDRILLQLASGCSVGEGKGGVVRWGK